MRVSIIRSGVAAIAAAVALAACGGHGIVPSQLSSSGAVAPAGDVVGTLPDGHKTSKCDIPGIYYFHGDCVAFTLNMDANSTVELGKFGAYHGIKITTTYGVFQNPPKGYDPGVPAPARSATRRRSVVKFRHCLRPRPLEAAWNAI